MNVEIINKLEFFPAITLAITNACRMNCSFCCDDNFSKVKINNEKINRIIDILIENKVKRICYSGGDPLLSPHLEEYLTKTHITKIENIVCTSDALQLSKLKISPELFTDLRLSIHGLHEEHDKISNVPNSFSQLEKVIPTINDKFRLSVTCVVRPEIIPKINEFVEWCIANKFKRLYLTNLLQSGKGEQFIEINGRLNGEDFANLAKKLQQTYSNQAMIIPHSFEKNAECIIIYANGDMFINPYYGKDDNKLKIGNILEEKPAEIFKRFKQDKVLWEDYCDRMLRSTLILDK